MSFKAVTDVKTAKAVIAAFFPLTEELTLKISPDEIHIKAMDPSHINMVNFHWLKTSFSEYSCSEPVTFGVIMNDLNSALKRLNGETLSMELDNGLLRITSKDKTYELRLIGAENLENVPEELKAEYTCGLETTINDLSSIIDDISIMSGDISFVTKEGNMICSGSGDSGKSTVKLKEKVEGEANSTYQIDYIRTFVKALSGLTEKTLLSVGMDTSPLKLVVFINEKLSLVYHLAPKDMGQK